jgi:ribonuclease HI
VGVKTHMGYNQEAYDAECAALSRAMEIAARRQTTPEQVAIFTNAQAAIRRMASEEPGPGQTYAIEAQRHIAELRRPRPDITVEIRWCPGHKRVPGNEKADEWAKLAAEEPDARGVEWLQGGARPMPLPTSLVHLKREISEKKWAEARQWAGGQTSREKYKMPAKQRPDRTVAGSSKRHASRSLPHRAIPEMDEKPTHRPVLGCPCTKQTRDHLFKVCTAWRDQQKILWAEVRKETRRLKSRWKVRDLLADERCSRALPVGLPVRREVLRHVGKRIGR